MLTADTIRSKSFETVRNGYDPDAVKAFLAEAAKEYAALAAANQENEEKIIKLAEKINEYREDEEAIKSALIVSQRESNKIINEAKAQARDMIESAKTEQVRLSEQSASECERIIREHKENCAKLIKENTEITQQKIMEIRAQYDDEKAEYENLKMEVNLFKSKLLELYQQQLGLIMQIPDSEVDEEYLEETEYVEEDEAEEEASEEEAAAPAEEEKPAEPEKDDAAAAAAETKKEHIDKILNTGSFEPVIPKENLQDLQFGKHK